MKDKPKKESKDPAVKSIKVLDNELEWLHNLIITHKTGYDDRFEYEIFQEIFGIIKLLAEITRKHNELEIK